MLCKEQGNYKIEKLRVIQLMEADLNMYLRLTWGKKLVRNAIQYNLFLLEQLGNKPGVLGSSAALLKVISFDLIYLLRINATVLNNNATACYDRIIPHLAQLCCQQLGLLQQAVDFMLNFLCIAQYHLNLLQDQ